MKLFVYKSLFIFGCILLLYKFTIGQEIKKFEEEISKISSKKYYKFKNKIKDELKSAIKKERILKKEEAILIKDLLLKSKN